LGNRLGPVITLGFCGAPVRDGGVAICRRERHQAVIAFPVVPERHRLVTSLARILWTSSDGGVTWRSRTAVLPAGLRATDTVLPAAGALFVRATDGTTVTVPRSLHGGIHRAELLFPVMRAARSP
jgi:hypothetical protein